MPDPVSDTLCRERQRVQDERFKRDLERIEDLEQVCDKLNRLSIEMSELVKKHDEQLAAQAQRLESIEQKPLRWWEKFTGAIIAALGSAVGGGMLALLIQNIVQGIMKPSSEVSGEGDFCLLSRQTIGDKGSTVVLEFEIHHQTTFKQCFKAKKTLNKPHKQAIY